MTDSSRFPALLIAKGWVEKLDKKLIPNFSNLIPHSRAHRSIPSGSTRCHGSPA